MQTLSAVDLLVPFHLCCCYKLTKITRDHLLVSIPPMIERFEVCHGFRHVQDPVFSYKSNEFIRNEDRSVWVVAYTKRVLRVCIALYMEVYDQYRLCCLPSVIIEFHYILVSRWTSLWDLKRAFERSWIYARWLIQLQLDSISRLIRGAM